MIFAYPQLTNYDLLVIRIYGHGLGNILLPWSRAMVASERFGLRFIDPAWLNFKWQAVMRWEKDKRFYHDLFLPWSDHRGLRRLRTLLRAPRIAEQDFDPTQLPRDEDRVVVFKGLGDYFTPILPDHALIRERLYGITRPKHLRALEALQWPAVCMHVRLGDFRAAGADAQLQQGEYNLRLPMDWYQDQLEQIEQHAPADWPIYLLSDGRPSQLRALTSHPRVRFLEGNSGLTDLWILAQASLLIASGSTYSMWGSYMGRMPVVWYPGQRRQRLYADPALEPENDGCEPWSETFRQAISGGRRDDGSGLARARQG